MLQSITIDKLLTLDNPFIIDIRNKEKYNDNHIPFAHNIEYNELLGNPKKYLSINNTYYLYCQKGIKSQQTCQILKTLGYNVFNIIGGYESYILNN